MQARILVEAEEVAVARWEATLPRAERRRRQQAALLSQVEAIINRCWTQTEPAGPRDIQAQLAEDGWGQAAGASATYRLFDGTGQPIRCHLCGRDSAWTPEGDAEQHRLRMFVCEHEPLRLGNGLVRQVSTVALHRVTRCETTRER